MADPWPEVRKRAVEHARRNCVTSNDAVDKGTGLWRPSHPAMNWAITAFLAAAREAGWVMVPAVPTPEMRLAGQHADARGDSIYTAMIAAADQHEGVEALQVVQSELVR